MGQRRLAPASSVNVTGLVRQSKRRGSVYWLRLLGFFLAVLLVALTVTPLLLGITTALALLYAPCHPSSRSPADYELPFETVAIQGRTGGRFQGYFIPGRNGATVIVPPPTNSGRAPRLDEAALLARHGFTVLMFESRPCAGLGPLSLGYQEVDEVAAALDFLLARPETDPGKIGIYGFSSAGATAVMAAARLPRLQAVVAEGGYGDFVQDSLPDGRGRNILLASTFALYRAGFRLTYRLITGSSVEQLSPVSVIAEIAPRPALLIYGSREPSLAGGRRQLEAAGPSAELWVVEGASHGDYLQVAPAAYERRVVEFFEGALMAGDHQNGRN